MKERNISTGMKYEWELYGILVCVLHRKHDKSYWEEGRIEETRQTISRNGTVSIDETSSTDDTSSDNTTS